MAIFYIYKGSGPDAPAAAKLRGVEFRMGEKVNVSGCDAELLRKLEGHPCFEKAVNKTTARGVNKKETDNGPDGSTDQR